MSHALSPSLSTLFFSSPNYTIVSRDREVEMAKTKGDEEVWEEAELEGEVFPVSEILLVGLAAVFLSVQTIVSLSPCVCVCVCLCVCLCVRVQ